MVVCFVSSWLISCLVRSRLVQWFFVSLAAGSNVVWFVSRWLNGCLVR